MNILNRFADSPHLIDVRQHVGEAGGEDDAAPEADPCGETPGQQATLTSLCGAQPAPPHPEQRQDTWCDVEN